MAESDPTDYLRLMQGIGEVAGTLDMLAKDLENQGWHSHNAQRAATMVLDNVMKQNTAQIQRGRK